MRKVTIKLKLKSLFQKIQGKLFDSIKKINMIELVKLDVNKGVKIIIVEITLLPGKNFEDIKLPKKIEIVDVFHQKGQKLTCLMKGTMDPSLKKFAKFFDIDVIWDTPCFASKGCSVYSFIGTEKQIKTLIRCTKLIGDIESVSYQNADYRAKNILSILTTKQAEIFEKAKEMGYYDYPRKIDGTGLAKNLGISKATVIEHLRKIENKIMNNIN